MKKRKNWGKIAGLVLHILIGGLMILTGSEKVLRSVPPEALARYGLGEQMRLIGAGALLTALLLLIPRTSWLGLLLTSVLGRRHLHPHGSRRALPFSSNVARLDVGRGVPAQPCSTRRRTEGRRCLKHGFT
jgi:hypothetical protein